MINLETIRETVRKNCACQEPRNRLLGDHKIEVTSGTPMALFVHVAKKQGYWHTEIQEFLRTSQEAIERAEKDFDNLKHSERIKVKLGLIENAFKIEADGKA